MDLTPVVRFGLLLIRPGMLVALAPGFGGQHIPMPVRIGLAVLVALGLLPSVAVPGLTGEVALTAIIVHEMAIGLSLALVMRALISAIEFAGHLSAHQIGFTYGATIDPMTGVRNTMLATLYGSLATLAFFAVNGHHAMLRALASSYTALPIGIGSVNESLVGAVRDVFAMVFVVGLRLGAPIIIVLVIVELAVGLISRTAPSLSFMVIGYPLRLLIGLFVLAALVGTVPAVTTSMLESTFLLAGRMAASFR